MLLLCLTRAVLFCRTTQHSMLKATVLSVTQSRLLPWWWKLLYMRASTVLHANTGVTCVRGQPCVQDCIVGKEWRKTPLLLFIFNSMYQQGKALLHSAASLKRENRSNHRGYKAILWGHLLANLETLCNLYSLVSAVNSPWISPPVSLSASLCPHLRVQMGSSSVKVSPPQCKSLPPQTPCRALRCGWWSSGSHKEAWRHSGPLHWR